MDPASLLGAGASLLGGIFDRNSQESADNKAWKRMWEVKAWDRRKAMKDRNNERSYLHKRTINDRKYAAKLLADDRAYEQKITDRNRHYDRLAQINDRKYMERRLNEDRTAYDQRSDQIQSHSETLAERSAASRGINFEKLRDDAIKAGYNPLTAMSMAHAYSTQVDYTDSRTPFAAGAGYNAQTGGGGGGGGPANAPMAGGAAPSHVAAGGGYSGGGGYQSSAPPALSSGAVFADAIARGADTFFNTPAEKDPLADSLRAAMAQSDQVEQMKQNSVPKTFGYDLTKQEAFKPATTLGTPPLQQGKPKTLAPPPSVGSQSDGMVNPSQVAINVAGGEFAPSGKFSDQEAGEARYGEIGGEILGVGALLTDLGHNARIAFEKARGRKLIKIGGKYYAQEETDGPPVSAATSDYIGSGTNGSQMIMRNPNPSPGWMNEAYGSSW